LSLWDLDFDAFWTKFGFVKRKAKIFITRFWFHGDSGMCYATTCFLFMYIILFFSIINFVLVLILILFVYVKVFLIWFMLDMFGLILRQEKKIMKKLWFGLNFSHANYG
jgi:hypothetical protein